MLSGGWERFSRRGLAVICMMIEGGSFQVAPFALTVMGMLDLLAKDAPDALPLGSFYVSCQHSC